MFVLNCYVYGFNIVSGSFIIIIIAKSVPNHRYESFDSC